MSEGEQPSGERGDQDQSHEQQVGDDVAYFADLPLGKAWRGSITRGRAAELERMLHAWEQEADHGWRTGPLDSVVLTGADVFWLAARTLAAKSEAHRVAAAAERLHLAHDDDMQRLLINLSALNLSSADLKRADLTSAELGGANLTRATLFSANLTRATLWHTNLTNANLRSADLTSADLTSADLTSADLTRRHPRYRSSTRHRL